LQLTKNILNSTNIFKKLYFVCDNINIYIFDNFKLKIKNLFLYLVDTTYPQYNVNCENGYYIDVWLSKLKNIKYDLSVKLIKIYNCSLYSHIIFN